MKAENLINITKNLTVAIPVRWTDERTDILSRVTFIKMDPMLPAEVEVLVVDDGSPIDLSHKLKRACAEHGFLYHRIDTEHLPFSIGRARNEAAQIGTASYLMFQDADLMPYPGFYADILRECTVAGLDESADNFIMIGVIYLTEQATKDFRNTAPEMRKQKYIQSLLEDDKTVIEKFSTGTSVTVWRRDYFLATGGNDTDFNGWGYEDLEYACRAIRRRKKFALPSEFTLDYRNFQSVVEYKGWKSIYRLFGDMTFQKGMVLFHAWHPVEQQSRYMAAKSRNRKLFETKLKAFRDHGTEPLSLAKAGSGKSLFLRNNPWVMNRWASPFLGELVHLDEDSLPPESFIAFLKGSGFSRVVFHNPYANERMQALYAQVRSNGFPFIVVERGALPDSVFFDAKGFNADSDSYHERHWDRSLTKHEREATLQYMQNAIIENDSLEEQPARIGPAALRKKLNIGRGKRVIVAFLQRPTDTVIKHFIGPIGSYEKFLRLLGRLPYTMPLDWILLVKQHPLEREKICVPGSLSADQYNTKDLLDLAEAMITVNSGVGVLGIIFGKPVLHCGDAFYSAAGLAKQVTDEPAVNQALQDFVPDREKSIRFISYLVNKFYSFGRFETRRVPWHDGSFMTATTDIDFYTVRVPGHPEMKRAVRDNVEISSTSILLDRYRKPDATLDMGTTLMAKPPACTGKRSGRWREKLKKFCENPILFLRDSRFFVLRLLGSRLSRQ